MGKNTIGAKIVLEGEKEYRKAIKDINTEQKELRSEMKLASSAFDGQQNSIGALTKKGEILSKQYDTQVGKVEIYSRAVTDSAKKQEEAGKKVDDLKEALDRAEKEMKEMQSASGTSKEALEKQQKAVEDLKGKLLLAEDGYSKAVTATSNWQTSLNNAKADLNTLDKQISENKGYLEEAEKSYDGCADSIDEYGKSTKEAGEKSEELGKKGTAAIDNIAGALAAAGIAAGVDKIRDALIDCSEEFKAFETVTAKVSTIADTSSKSMDVLSTEMLNTASEMRVAAKDIGDATYNALSAGVETASAVEFAGQATKLAVGGFTDSTTAVDILTTAINAYKLETQQATQVSDYLVTTQNLGKTTVAELAANMGKVIPIASAYNVQMDNLSTGYAILTANGIATADSTTYLKGMLNELGDSGSTVSKKLIEMTGKSFATLTKEGKSLGDVIAILGDSVNNDTGAFNELWSSSEAGVGALSILGGGAEKFNEVLEQMQDSAGATEDAFNTMVNVSEGADAKMEVALQNLKIAIGKELTPAINDMKEDGAGAFEWATDFVEEHPEVVKAIAALTAGVAVFTGGLAIASGAIAAFNAALSIAGPVGIAVTAIAGLVTVIGLVASNSDSATAKYKDLIKTTEETNASLYENISARKESQQSQLAELKVIDDLKTELFELNEKEYLNTEEKMRLKGVVDELNIAMPELNLAIDEQSGYLSMSNSEAEKYIDNMQKTLELGFMEEDLKEIAKEHYEAKKNLAEIEKEYQELQGKSEEIMDGWTKACNEGEQAMNAYNQELGERATDAVSTYNAAMNDMLPALEDARKAEQDLQEEYNNMQSSLADVRGEMDEAAKATNNLKDTTIEYGGKTYEVSSSVAESVKGIEKSYDEALAKASESLRGQVSLFEELSTASNLTTQEMSERLHGQAETFDTYSNDLKAAAELAKSGLLDEGLLGAIKDLGIDGAGYLHELVTAAEEDTGEFNRLMSEWALMEETRESLEATLADMASGYSEQMDNLLGIQEEKNEIMSLEYLATWEETNKSADEAMAEMVTLTSNGMEALTNTVKDNSPKVRKASEELCSGAIAGAEDILQITEDGKSLSFVSVGLSIPQGIAQGITDGQDMIKNALQNAIDNAIDSIDLSGIVAKVNRELGDLY